MRRSTIGLILAAPAAVVAACSFPEIFIAGEAGGSGGSTTSATSSSSSNGGSGGTGGSSSSSTTSDTSSTSASTSATSSTSTGSCTTDADNDHVISWECDPNDPAKDCADQDPRAFPDAGFQATPITGKTKPGTLPFDFNCNGVQESETEVLNCAGLLICGTKTGFQATVKCGESASLGHCVAAGVGCAWAPMSPDQTIVQHCK